MEYNTNHQNDTVIKNVSFEFQNRDKIAVIGKVGCGKTSLFLTILKELYITKGKITLDRRQIVYTEQNPLIICGTIRENVTFGLPYEEKWYQKVINACCLTQDFETFAQGDLTQLGEMGIQLSGGQRSRISLARALYRKEAKIVLIDGTLSALDVKVAQHVMNEAILGLCRKKIVFLVTYDLNQAAAMDYVMLMEDGQIKMLKRKEEFFNESENESLQQIKQ